MPTIVLSKKIVRMLNDDHKTGPFLVWQTRDQESGLTRIRVMWAGHANTLGKIEIADRRMVRIRCELNLESSTRVPNIMFVKSVKVPIESLMVGIMDGGTGVEGCS